MGFMPASARNKLLRNSAMNQAHVPVVTNASPGMRCLFCDQGDDGLRLMANKGRGRIICSVCIEGLHSTFQQIKARMVPKVEMG